MLFPLLGLVYFLAFSPQAVLSIFQLISYSFIQQCGPFNISFSGGVPPPDLPLTLTVLPFGSTPLSFTLPQSAWDNSTDTGSYVAFLPLPDGVSLIASLDDAFGNSAALASQVLQISSSHNTSCLSNTSITTTPPAFQLLDTNVSQCSPFSVTRKTTSPDYSISVRVFIPEGLSYWLQSISFDSSQGVDIYTFIMNVARGIQVALLFVDGKGNRQVSNLLSVAGDENSPTKCLEITSTSTAADSHLSLSRPAAIAIAVTSSVIVAVILMLGVFIIRRERRKVAALRGSAIDSIQNHDQSGEPGATISLPVPPQPSRPSRLPQSVPIAGEPADPVDLPSTSPRSSVFSPFIPSTLEVRRGQSNSSRNASIKTKSTIGSPNSRPLGDLDIAGLLEVASVKHRETETDTRPNSSTFIPAVPQPCLASSIGLRVKRLSSGWRRSHRDQDVPLSPLSGLSGVPTTTRGPYAMGLDMRVATPRAEDLSRQGTSRDAGAQSRSKIRFRF